MLDGIMKAIE